MALLGQQTPKIKTNLNEKKREKFGKQERTQKKKNWWKDQVLLKEEFNTAFPEYHIGKKYSSKHISYSGK